MGFFELALLEAALLGVLCGLTGTVVLLRRQLFYAVSLTHGTFPGAVAAVLLGIPVLLGAGVFSVVLVACMFGLSRVGAQGHRVAAGIVLTGGFALGSLGESLFRHVPMSVESFLVGSILSVSAADIWASAVALLLTLFALVVFGKGLLFSTFDPTGFRISGARPWVIECVALVLCTATVVVAMPAAGAMLSIALIAGPAACARLLSNNISRMLPLAASIGLGVSVLGLFISRWASIAAGASIALTACLCFVVVLTTVRIRRARRRVT